MTATPKCNHTGGTVDFRDGTIVCDQCGKVIHDPYAPSPGAQEEREWQEKLRARLASPVDEHGNTGYTVHARRDALTSELVTRLEHLTHPFAEAMSDKERIDRFVRIANEAAAVLARKDEEIAVAENNFTGLRASWLELDKQRCKLIAAKDEEIARLREALASMIYETTHLSQREDDGSHWCRISPGTLAMARAALDRKEG